MILLLLSECALELSVLGGELDDDLHRAHLLDGRRGVGRCLGRRRLGGEDDLRLVRGLRGGLTGGLRGDRHGTGCGCSGLRPFGGCGRDGGLLLRGGGCHSGTCALALGTPDGIERLLAAAIDFNDSLLFEQENRLDDRFANRRVTGEPELVDDVREETTGLIDLALTFHQLANLIREFLSGYIGHWWSFCRVGGYKKTSQYAAPSE